MPQRGKSVGVFTTDRALVLQTWDPWLSEATGVAETTACGRPLAELFPELLERGLLSRLRRVADEGNVEVLAPAFHHYLIPCPPRDRSSPFQRMRQHVTLAPLRAGATIIGVVVTIEDVTPRLEREQELAAQLESHDEDVRVQAIRAMATAAGASALVDALADRSWRVRRAAAEGLARASGAQAVDTLIEALRERHHDPAVLNSALSALAQSKEDVVGSVVGLLTVGDAAVRTYAALALGLLEDSRAVPALLGMLGDPDVNVRYHAIEALGRIGDTAAADALAGIAESRDFFLAFPALDALAAIGEASVASRLLPLLHDDALRETAAQCLGAIGGEDIAAPLARLVTRDFATPVAIARALASIDARMSPDDATPSGVPDRVRDAVPLEAAAVLIDRLPAVADADAEGIAIVLGWLPGEGVNRALAALLSRDGIRSRVSAALSRRGVTAVDALLGALATDNPAVQQACAVALGRIGDARAVPALMSLLQAEPDVAIAAAGALGAMGDRNSFEQLLAQLGNPHAMVRQAAVSALNSIGHRDTEWAIASRLSDPDPNVRESAARIAGYFGFPSALPALLSLTDDPEEAVRRAVVEHLANFDDENATRAIHHALERDTAISVRSAAVRALGQVDASEAAAALVRACSDPNLWVRYFAVRTLARRGDTDSDTLDLIASLAASDPMPPVRIAALDAIGDLGEVAVASTVAELTADPEGEVARAAILTLGRIGSPAHEATLTALLHQGERQRAAAALESIGRLRLTGAVGPVRAMASESDDWELRIRAVGTLAEIGGAEALSAMNDLTRIGRLRRTVRAAMRQAGMAS